MRFVQQEDCAKKHIQSQLRESGITNFNFMTKHLIVMLAVATRRQAIFMPVVPAMHYTLKYCLLKSTFVHKVGFSEQ
jgi:hypothetical protein